MELIYSQLKQAMQVEVADDPITLARYSRDASLFEVKPQVVVFPKNAEDIKSLVKFVAEHKANNPELSLTARSAGTDMSGGPLNESIILDFTKHFTHIKEVTNNFAITEPGVFYRDFEKETLKFNALMPSYPASREICTVGGMVANNAGGEKSLRYGKTKDYINSLRVVLADGNEYSFTKLTRQELDRKMAQQDFEGKIYREVFNLLDSHRETLQRTQPNVSKNSSGYNIWEIWDGTNFDLTKLFVGSQGTLGIITEINFKLVKTKPHTGMLVIYEYSLDSTSKIVNAVLPFKPTSFEGFDHYTLRLAMRFLPDFVKLLKAKSLLALAWRFLPDFWQIFTHGMPAIMMLVEFENDSETEIIAALKDLQNKLKKIGIKSRLAPNKTDAEKYWLIRRESFNLLRKKVKDKQTAPFIDDIIVRPESLPEFLPKLYAILDKYKLLYTIAGHIGDGNFHIIPLMKLADPVDRGKIIPAMREIYALVFQYHGSMTAEHNDGLIRTPFLKQMYGIQVCEIFEKIKNIFDPENIFNPRKKVGGDVNYLEAHIKKT